MANIPLFGLFHLALNPGDRIIFCYDPGYCVYF